MGISLSEAAVLVAITFFGSFVHGTIGFGFGMVTVSTYSLILGVRVANPISTLFNIVIQVGALSSLYRSIQFRNLLPLILGIAVGMPIGVWVLTGFDETYLRLALGVLVLVFVAFSAWGNQKRELRPSWVVGVPVGLISGLLGGAFGIPGPPVVMYMSSLNLDKRELKASMLFVFMLMTLYKVPLLAVGGLYTPQVFRLTAAFAGVVVLGILLGTVAFERVSHRLFRIMMLVLLAISGLSLITRSVLALVAGG